MSGATCEVWTRTQYELVPSGLGGHFGDIQVLIPLTRFPRPFLIGYTNYQGSSDIIAPEIVGEDGDRWKTGWGALERCSHRDHTPAWAYSWYGGGDHWPVEVCLSCRVIHGEVCPYGPDVDGWSNNPEIIKREREWRAAGWPKKGPPPGVIAFDERGEDK